MIIMLIFWFMKKTTSSPSTDFSDVLKDIVEHYRFKTYYKDRNDHYDHLTAVHARLDAHRTRLLHRWTKQRYFVCIQQTCEYISLRRSHHESLKRCILSEEFCIQSAKNTSHHYMRHYIFPSLIPLGISSSRKYRHQFACMQQLVHMWAYQKSNRLYFKIHVLDSFMDHIRSKIHFKEFFSATVLSSMMERVESIKTDKQQIHQMLYFKERCLPLISTAAIQMEKKRTHNVFVQHMHHVVISCIIMICIVLYSWTRIIYHVTKNMPCCPSFNIIMKKRVVSIKKIRMYYEFSMKKYYTHHRNKRNYHKKKIFKTMYRI